MFLHVFEIFFLGKVAHADNEQFETNFESYENLILCELFSNSLRLY